MFKKPSHLVQWSQSNTFILRFYSVSAMQTAVIASTIWRYSRGITPAKSLKWSDQP